MDETACWFDMLEEMTVALTGSRAVVLKTTGHEKSHYTVILTARADGKKLKPFIVFKGKGTHLIKELPRIPGVIVQFSDSGWKNNQLTKDYLRQVVGQISFTKRLMIWDAYKCHVSEETRKELDHLKMHGAVIPGGCTKFMYRWQTLCGTLFSSTCITFISSMIPGLVIQVTTSSPKVAILNLLRVPFFVSR